MRRIEEHQPMSVWLRTGGTGFRMGAWRAEGTMNRYNSAEEDRRGPGRRVDSDRFAARCGDGECDAAPRRKSADDSGAPDGISHESGAANAGGFTSDGGEHSARNGPGSMRHDQLVFVTSFGVPIGPSVQEALSVPDGLDDTLPPGDLPGQLLLDLGLA